MGAVTPVGIGVPAYWQGINEGKCGIVEKETIGSFTQPGLRMALVDGFDPKAYLSTKLTLDLEPYMQYAYVAAEEAVQQSGLDTDSDRIGIVMGTALAGIVMIGETNAQLAVNGKQAGPKFLTKAMGNIAAAQFSINHKIKGPSLTVTTACSSGGDATTIGSILIRSGMADAVVVMAGEAAVCPPLVQSLIKTGALSKTGEKCIRKEAAAKVQYAVNDGTKKDLLYSLEGNQKSFPDSAQGFQPSSSGLHSGRLPAGKQDPRKYGGRAAQLLALSSSTASCLPYAK